MTSFCTKDNDDKLIRSVSKIKNKVFVITFLNLLGDLLGVLPEADLLLASVMGLLPYIIPSSICRASCCC